MARLNTRIRTAATTRSPIKTGNTLTATTGEGAPAYQQDDKSALFLLATGRFFGEDAFYEKTDGSTNRFRQLCRTVAVADPQWYGHFVRWLRHEGNIRTGAIVAAAEGAAAWQKAGMTGSTAPHTVRSLVSSALVRADEPGEFVAYWRAHIRRALSGGVQRGLADAAGRLYNQRNVIKWDSSAKGYRFADVVELAHAQPVDSRQSVLFKYLLDERHHSDGKITEELTVLAAYKEAQKNLREDRDGTLRALTADSELLNRAGMTWENLSSSGPMDKAAWEAIIPNMGYMALLRNLRNFDEAGVSDKVKDQVAARLSDQAAVLNSRQLPYRFLSAYLEAQGRQWQGALETALQYSLANIPTLSGKTLVLIDTSGSMSQVMSQRSKVTAVQAGALFGVALAAAQGSSVVYGFADGPGSGRGRWGYASNTNPFQHQVSRGAAVLRTTFEFANRVGENGHGTEVTESINWALARHPDVARIVVISDMQTMSTTRVNTTIPIYAFNTGGYGSTPIESGGTRHQLGALTDHTFALIKNIEAAQTGTWPWEQAQAPVEPARSTVPEEYMTDGPWHQA